MESASECWLIHETPGTHGVHDANTDELRHRYCTVRSVGRSEYYQASVAGLKPRYAVKLALAAEYDDEHEMKIDGKVWRITRVYKTSDGGIELTVQRSDTE